MLNLATGDLLQFVGFAGAIVTVYVGLTKKITKLEVKQDLQDLQNNEIKKDLTHIQETLTKILISLENKTNR